MEQAHADAGILNKWKYLFYVLVIAYTLMRVAVLMIRQDPVGAVEEVIRNGVLLGVLHIFWDKAVQDSRRDQGGFYAGLYL